MLHIFPPYIWMLILLVGIFYSVKFLIKKSQKTFLLKLTVMLGMIICLWAVDYYSFNILSSYFSKYSDIFIGMIALVYITCLFLVDYQNVDNHYFFVGGYQSIQLENDMEKKNSSLKSLIIDLIATVLLIILIWVG